MKIYMMRRSLRPLKEPHLQANPNLVRKSSIMLKNGASALFKKRNMSKISCNSEKRVAYKRLDWLLQRNSLNHTVTKV